MNTKAFSLMTNRLMSVELNAAHKQTNAYEDGLHDVMKNKCAMPFRV